VTSLTKGFQVIVFQGKVGANIDLMDMVNVDSRDDDITLLATFAKGILREFKGP